MTSEEIVQALRCCAKGLGHDDACENCKVGELCAAIKAQLAAWEKAMEGET